MQTSPFHRGERQLQTALGVRDKVEKMGQRVIRDHVPEQHADFYADLPFVFLGSVDENGRPWASMLTGRAGFISTPEPRTLLIDATPTTDDALQANLTPGAPLGLLGIDYAARRRNRLTGTVASAQDHALRINVHQTFGNCPMYIQGREYTPPLERIPKPDTASERLDRFDADAKALVRGADNFYIATHALGENADVRRGADVSHRGGNPGFVRIDDDHTLTFPDFRGNRHFNTLGNIEVTRRAGLLFVDFANGDLLQLTGAATIDHDHPDIANFAGAERLVRFHLETGTRLRRAIPGTWTFIDYSPRLAKTGTWGNTPQGANR